MAKSFSTQAAFIAAIFVCWTSSPHELQAQEVASAAPGGGLQEIVVTAERRSEDIQRVPIAVTVVTDEQLKNKGLVVTDDLSAAVPGLEVNREVNQATIYIRGVGASSAETGEEGSTALYLDDLYVPQGAAGLFQLNDISNIEVLKGPQGTLFGRNATAGVVQVHTRDPTAAPALDAHVGYANYNTKSGDIYVTGSLTNNLTGNFAAYGYDESQGWGRDLYTGEHTFTEKDAGFRAKLLWAPGENTNVKLTAGFNYTQGEVGVGLNEVPGIPGCCGAHFVGFYNNVDTQNDNAISRHGDVQLRIEHNFGWASLVSISGWQDLSEILSFNEDGFSDAPAVLNVGHQFGHDVSEELQILSPESTKLKWIGGFYYLHDSSGYDPAALTGTAFGFPLTHFPTEADPYIGAFDTIKTNTYAGYGQSTFEIVPKTNLTAGVRWTTDYRSARAYAALSPALGGTEISGVLCGMALCPFTPKKNFSQWTYRAGLDHRFTDDIMSYVSVNRGYKSGEYDTVDLAFNGPAGDPPVKPETLQAYEVGTKSQFFQRKLQLNIAAFYYNYKNIQLTENIKGFSKLLNATDATIKGGELELKALPTESLQVTAGISVLYGKYGSFTNAPAASNPATPGCNPCSIDASGADTIRSPHFTGSLSADYKVPSSIGLFNLNVTYTYISTFEWTPDQQLSQPVTNLVNTSLLWTHPGGVWDVRLWGRNLSGAKYYSYANEEAGVGTLFSPSAPRTYGITFGLHL